MLLIMSDARDIVDQSTASDKCLSKKTSQIVTLALIAWRTGLHKICMCTYIRHLFKNTRLCQVDDTQTSWELAINEYVLYRLCTGENTIHVFRVLCACRKWLLFYWTWWVCMSCNNAVYAQSQKDRNQWPPVFLLSGFAFKQRSWQIICLPT